MICLDSGGRYSLDIIRECWRKASVRLGFRAELPFVLKTGRTQYQCIAFLPDFGGEKGMIIVATWPPDFFTDSELIEKASALGYFYSFINGEDFEHYEEQTIKEALKDWGFFGDSADCPVWLQD